MLLVDNEIFEHAQIQLSERWRLDLELHPKLSEEHIKLIFENLLRELGIIIFEKKGFPDYTVKINMHKYKIEVERELKDFYRHKHNPKECDIIAVWENISTYIPGNVTEFKRLKENPNIKILPKGLCPRSGHERYKGVMDVIV